MTDETLLQRARDIVADVFVVQEAARGKSNQFDTFEAWGRYVDSYAKFMREGAYDDDMAVVATLTALQSVQVNTPALQVSA